MIAAAARPAPWQRWLLGLLLAAAVLETAKPLWNADLFWHLSSGRLFLEHQSLPEQDPLTYTAGGRPWVHHEWLAQVLLAIAEKGVGLAGLRGIRSLLAVAGLALLWLICRRRLPAGAALVALAVAWVGLEPSASLRPHLVAWPLAVLVLAGLLPALTAGARGWRPWAALAIFVVVWVNLHSSALVVPLLLLAHASGGVIDRWTGRLDCWRPVLAAAVASGVAGLACLVQPAGFSLLAYARATPAVNVMSSEWAPLLTADTWRSFPSVVVCWSLTSLAVGVAGIAERRRRLVMAFPGFWVAAACLLMAAQHRRMSLFFFLPALYLAAPVTAGLESLVRGVRPAVRRLLVAAALVGAATLALVALPDAVRPGALREGVFPENAADLLEAADLRGRLFHDINWGGYLGYRRFPRQQVFADGRWLLAGPEVMADYPRLYLRAAPSSQIEALYDRYQVEVLVQPTRDVLQLPGLQPARWRLAWIGPVATVLLRRGPAFEGNVKRLCDLYRRYPGLEQRASWPVEVRRPDGGSSPSDIPTVRQLCDSL